MAVGDPAELDILVTNLVTNAMKYSADDSTVTRDPVARRATRSCFSCEDHGHRHLAAPTRRQLFREFFRSDCPRSRRRPAPASGSPSSTGS